MQDTSNLSLVIAVLVLLVVGSLLYLEAEDKRALCKEKGGVWLARDRVCAKPDNFIPL